jgi:hypothetical protein
MDRNEKQGLIYVVSGLPRSGTSMAMAILQAAGLPLFSDGSRLPDEDNLGGYFEHEAVKRIRSDNSWLSQALGKVVKVISPSLEFLPVELNYRVVFMRRDLTEVCASQEQMLRRRGKEPKEGGKSEMIELMQRHLNHIDAWLVSQANVEVLYLNYADLIQQPLVACRILAQFLALESDIEQLAKVVDPCYYRQRAKNRVRKDG